MANRYPTSPGIDGSHPWGTLLDLMPFVGIHYGADQLTEAFSTLFQICVVSGQTPTSWKMSTMIQ